MRNAFDQLVRGEMILALLIDHLREARVLPMERIKSGEFAWPSMRPASTRLRAEKERSVARKLRVPLSRSFSLRFHRVLFGEILRLSPRLSQPRNRLIRPLADSGGCARDVRSLYGVKTAGTKKILPESSLCVLCTFARDQS
jgi:hypothetical protein